MGTQKNRLKETVLLSTKTNVNTDWFKDIYSFTLKYFVPLNKWSRERFLNFSPHWPHRNLGFNSWNQPLSFCCMLHILSIESQPQNAELGRL